MKRVFSAIVILATVALLCGSVQAAKNAPAGTQPAGTPEVQQLRTAYKTLYIADHDYHGHRIAAMHAIEKACDLLGTDIRGDGKGHIPQAISDEDLTQAKATITAVLQGGVATSQPKVARHLNKAIEEITIALKVH